MIRDSRVALVIGGSHGTDMDMAIAVGSVDGNIHSILGFSTSPASASRTSLSSKRQHGGKSGRGRIARRFP